MTTRQPEALRLADLFELESDPESLYRLAAAELRRLHALAAGQATAAQPGVAYAALPEPDIAVGNDGRARIYTRKDIVGEPYYTAGQLRDFADATCALRASHGQAPAETGNSVSAQADSVQEDAARLDWLEQNLFHREKDEWDTKFGGYKEYNMWVLFSPKGIRGRARDIIDAARKEGGAA